MTTPAAPTWHEVADRVWVLTHPWLEVNSIVVGGAAGLVVVDTLGSDASARAVLGQVAAFAPRAHPSVGQDAGVLAIVNTHWHFDHSFGNAAFAQRWPEARLVAHEDAAAELARDGDAMRLALTSPTHPEAHGHSHELENTEILVPPTTFSAAHVIDLGERRVELLHLGQGHTSGDIVVHVPDADVVLAGDLVEESGAPCYGDDSYPLEWPRTLDVLLQMLGTSSVVVPGHGRPVSRDFVAEQRAGIGGVAETIRSLAGDGVPLDQALGAARWPFDPSGLGQAVRRGYAQLPRAQRRLPLV